MDIRTEIYFGMGCKRPEGSVQANFVFPSPKRAGANALQKSPLKSKTESDNTLLRKLNILDPYEEEADKGPLLESIAAPTTHHNLRLVDPYDEPDEISINMQPAALAPAGLTRETSCQSPPHKTLIGIDLSNWRQAETSRGGRL